MKRIITFATILILASQVGAIDLGKKLALRLVNFPLNPAMDTGVYNAIAWPDSATVVSWATSGADTGNTTSQVIFGTSTTTVTAAGLAALGIRADSVGTNTPMFVFCDTARILNAGTTPRQIAGNVILWKRGAPFTTNFSMEIYADTLKDEVKTIAGTTQTARDIGASVLLSSGTGTGQLNFTSGVVQADAAKVGGQTASAAGTVTFPGTIASSTNITSAAGVALAADQAVNVTKWNGGAVVAPNVTGVPIVDLKYILGTQTDTTGASGRLAVNMRYVANQLCAASAGVTFPASIASPTNITSATGIQVSSYAAGQDPGSKVWGDNDSTWAAGTMGNLVKNDSVVIAAAKALLDDLWATSGWKPNTGFRYVRTATKDTLYLDTSGVAFKKRVFMHPGGTPGGVPDSSRSFIHTP